MEYYALVQRQYRPLFDDNYDDTVCLDDRHREAMIAYVHDNPRRAILRRLMPDVMQRCLRRLWQYLSVAMGKQVAGAVP